VPRRRPDEFVLSREEAARNFRARAEQVRAIAHIVRDKVARQALLQKAARFAAAAGDPACWERDTPSVAPSGLPGRPRKAPSRPKFE
jgi:hypothetical protein